MIYFNMIGTRLLLNSKQIFRIYFFCWLALSYYCPSATAQDQQNLFTQIMPVADTFEVGLHDAVMWGLENNPTVTIQRLMPPIMETYVEGQESVFDTTLDATGQNIKIESSRRLGSTAQPFDLTDERFNFSLGLTKAFSTGTTVAVDTGMTGSVSSLYTDQYTGSLGLTITQSLLKGFGPRANLANLRKARLDVDMSRFELKGTAEGVTANIEKGYWNLYLSSQEIEIQGKSLALAEKQLEESKERVNVGKLPELELAAVRAEVAERRGALIDAQGRHEKARLAFLFLISPRSPLMWNNRFNLSDKPFLPTDKIDSIDTHAEMARKYRSDLLQANLAMEKGELEIERTKNGLLPRLDLFIRLGKTSYAASFDDAYPDFTSPYDETSMGINFSYPLSNRSASSQLNRAKYSLEQQLLAVRNMERLVQLDIRSAYVEVLRSRQQIEATRISKELQEKKLSAEQEKFRVGKSTNFLVLQAQRDFTASELNNARSMVDYLYALINLYLSEGTLLQRRGINTFEN